MNAQRRHGERGFSLAELTVVVAIMAIILLIAIPVFRASTARATDAVLEQNSKLINARVATLVAAGYDTTYQRSGRGQPSVHLSRRLEQEVNEPPTADEDDIQGLRNPVSSNSNVINQNTINRPEPTPPALFVTSGSAYRYDRIRTNPDRLAGTIVVTFNTRDRVVEIFFMDEDGVRSEQFYRVPMG